MAHFLVDASLPRPAAGLIRGLGHEATDVRDIGLGTASDEIIAEYARTRHLCLITRDQHFGNVQRYPPQDYSGIVVIHAPDPASRSVVLALVQGFLEDREVVDHLVGRLAVVQAGRTRLRPPLP
jgi:predicted nuclease of predicted toxin-antitoxin system